MKNKSVNSKVVVIMAILVLSILILISYSFISIGKNEVGRQTIKKLGKEIVVQDYYNPINSSDIRIQKIDKYEDMYGVDWLDDNTILVNKDNKNLKPIISDGEKGYPNNLYLYNIKQGKLSLLHGESMHQICGSISPDKKHIFYKTIQDKESKGYVVNNNGKNKVNVTCDSMISVFSDQWIGNQHISYFDIVGNLYFSDLIGNVTYLGNIKQNINYSYFLVGKYTCYTISKNNIIKMDFKNDKYTVLTKGVNYMKGSPDKKNIAVIKKGYDMRYTFTLIDLNGKEKALIAKSDEDFLISWSKDSKKIAYVSFSEDADKKGLFIYDLSKNKNIQLSTEAKSNCYNLNWNYSGTKLLVTSKIVNNYKFEYVTDIITLGT